MSTDLYKQLHDLDNLEIGWHLAHGDSRDDFVDDPINYADYAFMKRERLAFISERLANHRYRSRPLTNIDLPKSGLSVRPGNTIHIEDAIVIHAAAYLLAPKIDHKLGSEVYSYRLSSEPDKRAKRAKRLFNFTRSENIPFLKNKTLARIARSEPWHYAWPTFDKASRDAIHSGGYTHLTITDISAYFENIDLSILHSIFNNVLSEDDRPLIDFLINIFTGWTRRTSRGVPIGRGIPQGNDVSSFLGNIYLFDLDSALRNFSRNRDAIWFRYMDDVKVFTKSYDDARNAVFEINSALRALHLNIQGSKTKILSGDSLKHEINDSELDRINASINKLKLIPIEQLPGRNPSHLTEIKDIRQQFTSGGADKISGQAASQNRLFRRTLTLFGMSKSAKMRQTALLALERLPDNRTLNAVLRYFSKLPYEWHTDIINDLLLLIENRKLLFDYQIAKVFNCITCLQPKQSVGIGPRVRKIGLDRSPHWYVQQKCLQLINILPYPERYIAGISKKGLAHHESRVKRAGLTLLGRSNVNNCRNEINKYIYHPDTDLSQLALFWHRLMKNELEASRYLTRVGYDKLDDTRFVQAVPHLYVLRCSENPKVVQLVRNLVSKLPYYSKSGRVFWHRRELLKATQWIEQLDI